MKFWYPVVGEKSVVGDYSKEAIGGKAYGLHLMAEAGVPVPQALVIPAEVCVKYMTAPAEITEILDHHLEDIYKWMSMWSGDKPPIMSVRSGARVSMPGMMDTILNVGLDGAAALEWLPVLGQKCVHNSVCRLVEMYANVVHQIKKEEFHGLDEPSLRWSQYLALTGHVFPPARQQLRNSILAVFNSWNNERAQFYREQNNIPHTWGTACVIQRMVFGNFNDESCTGVLFTRDPASGEDNLVGEFAVNAQGEDVVSGAVTPRPLKEMGDWNPVAHAELLNLAEKLEVHFGDVQDIEFTVEAGKVYLLQTRNAKRTPQAAVRIAAEMAKDAKHLKQLLSFKQFAESQVTTLSPKFKNPPDFTGLPASPGVVSAKMVFSSTDAINCTEPCILVTEETLPDDIKGMAKSIGILTMTGGHTSHAAVVARGMNKPCIVGLGKDLKEFKKAGTLGTKVSICGATGRVWWGEVPTVSGDSAYVETIKQMVVKYNPDVALPGVHFLDVSPQIALGIAPIKAAKPQVRGRPIEEAEAIFCQMVKTPGVIQLDHPIQKYVTGENGLYVTLEGHTKKVEPLSVLVKRSLG